MLEVIDDFSWLYRRTTYQNYKYFNDTYLYGSIPPYHLAHCRFFVNLDGNKLKRGLKVVASSIGTLYKHHFDIKKIMLPVCTYSVIKSMSIGYLIWRRSSFQRQLNIIFWMIYGKRMRCRERTWCICSLCAREIGVTLSRLLTLVTSTDSIWKYQIWRISVQISLFYTLSCWGC